MNKKRLLTLRPHLDMSMIRESDSRRGRDGFAPELEDALDTVFGDRPPEPTGVTQD